MEPPPGAGRAVLRRSALVAVVLTAAAVTVTESSGSFSAATTNPANNWAAGQVSLTDDDSGSALFTATGLKPGLTGVKCVKVTYTGNLASSVRLYATGYTGTLGTYLDLTVERGSGGVFADCTGFSGGSTVYSGTLAAFAAARTGYATGTGGFAAPGNPASATYRFTYLLQDNDSAQGLTSACAFTWEAQSPG